MGVFDENNLPESGVKKAATTKGVVKGRDKPTGFTVPKVEVDTEATIEKTEETEVMKEEDVAQEEAVPTPTPAFESPKPFVKKVEKVEKFVYEEGKKPYRKLTDVEMRDYLMSYPKVSIHVPLEAGEKKGATEIVSINGVQLNILKGTMVEIPKPFADLLMNFLNIHNSITAKSAD